MRYFTCSLGGSGSFLKPGKFSRGVSMAEALRQHYVDMDAPLVAPQNLLPDAYAATSKGGKKVCADCLRTQVAPKSSGIVSQPSDGNFRATSLT